MGLGDDIITTAIAKRAYQRVKMPLCIGDGQRVHWSLVFENNPKLARDPYPGCVWIHSYKGKRPYIAERTETCFVYEPGFRAEPGEIFLTDAERAFAPEIEPGFVLIEPNVKNMPFSKNKAWGIERWNAVVRALPHIRFVQLKTGKYKLDAPNVQLVGSPGIRQGFVMMERASLFVGTDGALHHSAAALGKPAVVVWGGLASPVNLGYPTHVNLHAGSKPCGQFMPCLHCQYELDKITVDMVVDAVRKEHERATAGAAAVPNERGRAEGAGTAAAPRREALDQQAGALQAV